MYCIECIIIARVQNTFTFIELQELIISMSFYVFLIKVTLWRIVLKLCEICNINKENLILRSIKLSYKQKSLKKTKLKIINYKINLISYILQYIIHINKIYGNKE